MNAVNAGVIEGNRHITADGSLYLQVPLLVLRSVEGAGKVGEGGCAEHRAQLSLQAVVSSPARKPRFQGRGRGSGNSRTAGAGGVSPQGAGHSLVNNLGHALERRFDDALRQSIVEQSDAAADDGLVVSTRRPDEAEARRNVHGICCAIRLAHAGLNVLIVRNIRTKRQALEGTGELAEAAVLANR